MYCQLERRPNNYQERLHQELRECKLEAKIKLGLFKSKNELRQLKDRVKNSRSGNLAETGNPYIVAKEGVMHSILNVVRDLIVLRTEISEHTYSQSGDVEVNELIKTDKFKKIDLELIDLLKQLDSLEQS